MNTVTGNRVWLITEIPTPHTILMLPVSPHLSVIEIVALYHPQVLSWAAVHTIKTSDYGKASKEIYNNCEELNP